MKAAEASFTPGWRARLRLSFDMLDGRTRLAERSHEGPLIVQKPLYPEGRAVCQAIVVHPPGGVAGGDELEIAVAAAQSAQVQITTPGATKWYRGFEREAAQRTRLSLKAGSLCEWLPQENIVFDGAQADMRLDVELETGAICCGWEFTCLGRPGSHAPFSTGRLIQSIRLGQEGVPLFRERATLEGGNPLLGADTMLAGRCAYATMFVAGVHAPEGILDRAREILHACPTAGITAMESVLVARWVGDRIEEGRSLFTSLWAVLRPWYAGRMAVVPRIWAT